MNTFENNILTVSQLTGLIKTMLENSFTTVVLKGEISNFRPNVSGHLYFVLKDAESQISAVMFRGNAQYLKFAPKDGMLVQVRGKITVYPKNGNYQILITSMEASGDGDIMEIIEMRKRKLASEGLFDSSHKKPIPRFPKTIGVVTSPTGAALQDIINIAKRRNPKVNIIVFPAIVQGAECAESVCRQIFTANKYKMCDTLIVGRGGGSLEDLLPFSEESVVRAVYNSDIPVITAVGHEIDFSLCDFASDVRAPTPSAAAEIAIPLLTDTLNRIQDAQDQMIQTINSKIERLKLMMNRFTKENMEMQFRIIEQPYMMRYDKACDDLIQNMNYRIDELKRRISDNEMILNNCNPQSIFNRGYSMVVDAQTGKVIRSPDDTKTGSEITIVPAKGKLTATVTRIQNGKK